MDLTVLARIGLLLIRPGMLIALAPGLGGTYLEAKTKIGLTFLIAIGLLPTVTISNASVASPLTLVVAREMAIGLSIAFVMRALVSGAEFAGHLSGFQIGFSYGATVDPQSGVRNTMVSTLYGMLATLGFLAVNGHHALLRAIAASYMQLPIGEGHINASLVSSVREIFALVFTVAVRLAAPIIAILIVVELIIGLISRAQPALSFMVIGYPIRMIVGLFVLGLVVGTVPGVVSGLTDRTIRLALETAGAFR